jgi:hypothetical protein
MAGYRQYPSLVRLTRLGNIDKQSLCPNHLTNTWVLCDEWFAARI